MTTTIPRRPTEPQPKFKVGDKVKIVSANYVAWCKDAGYKSKGKVKMLHFNKYTGLFDYFIELKTAFDYKVILLFTYNDLKPRKTKQS